LVPNPIVALQLRPLHAQRDPILDVALAGPALLVLTPTTVTRVPLPGQPVVATQSAAIATGRVWPRDLRGHLRADGGAFEVFLPGVTCRGPLTLFALGCADEGEPWPIGIENAGMAASRNTFATPEGFSFYPLPGPGLQGDPGAEENPYYVWVDPRDGAYSRRTAGSGPDCGSASQAID